MSKKEFESVIRQVGIDSMVDPKAKDKELLTMLNYLSNKEEKVYLNQHILKTPIVRNGKLATVGYEPNVWKHGISLCIRNNLFHENKSHRWLEERSI